MSQEQEFKIFLPADIESSIDKSAQSIDSDTGEGDWYVRGYASTPDLDLQGDVVLSDAIDIQYFKKHGWINYEHKQAASDVIGIPTDSCKVDRNGLFVEAKLFKDNQKAIEMWQLANSLNKTGSDRKVGFSIEGVIRKRSDLDDSVIEDVFVKNVAITKNPANPNATWETLVKSYTTGHEVNPEKQTNAGALRKEELAEAVTNLSYAMETLNKNELDVVWSEVAKYLDKSGKNTTMNTLLLLQLSKGISRDDARSYIENN